ncbi:MAG: hypothetical protein IPF93_00225 [Saprospiraceae bacterium]|nr:hypothetical protein [Saprospiraceae bacterium]
MFTNTSGAIAQIQENHYYPFGMELAGWIANPTPPYAYKNNGKELNSDFGLNLSDYGARWYDAGVGRFSSVDRFTDKYSFMTPYQYGANNPINFIDVNGDSIRISTGENGFVNYYPGQKYTGSDEFVRNISEALNTLYSSTSGSKVLKQLSSSTNYYDYTNKTSKNDQAGAVYQPNSKGGGKILAGKDKTVTGLAHESFHAYQHETRSINLKSTSAEVEAYLFQNIVELELGGGATVLSSSQNGKIYDKAQNYLLYQGYDIRQYIRASLFFKDSERNSSRLYDKYIFDVHSKPPIKSFIPLK